MTFSSRFAVAAIAAASFGLCLGCGGQQSKLSPQAIFVAKTDGDVQSRFSRIHDLKTRLQSRSTVDLDDFRTELIAYSDSVVETANSIVRDPKAADSQKSQAIDYAFEAIADRGEAAPKDALKQLADEVDLIEGLTRGTVLASQTLLHHVRGLDSADDAAFDGHETRSTTLAAAIQRLAAASPKHPDIPEMLDLLARKAEHRGDVKREKILCELLTTHFPDDPLAERAKRTLKRINALQTVLTDFQGVDENGKTVDLKNYRGKVVVVFFWTDQGGQNAVGLSEAINEMHRNKDTDVVFIGISIDAHGGRAAEYSRQAGVQWVQIVESGNQEDPLADQTPELAKRLGIDSAPYYLIVDRQGRLAAFGPAFPTVRPVFDRLVAPATAPVATTKAVQ
jgi:cytochrome oxidase Cu insertion factor (SCO1/SenC/PrrC family)